MTGAAAVAGGLVVGGCPELYDEESGRWVTLPHAMVEPGRKSGLISVPAAALVAVAAADVPH